MAPTVSERSKEAQILPVDILSCKGNDSKHCKSALGLEYFKRTLEVG